MFFLQSCVCIPMVGDMVGLCSSLSLPLYRKIVTIMYDMYPSLLFQRECSFIFFPFSPDFWQKELIWEYYVQVCDCPNVFLCVESHYYFCTWKKCLNHVETKLAIPGDIHTPSMEDIAFLFHRGCGFQIEPLKLL